jgi:hypothetical protein
VPIFVEGEWWRIIGFDECERERGRSQSRKDTRTYVRVLCFAAAAVGDPGEVAD